MEDSKEPMNEFVCHMSDIGNYAICSNFITPIKDKFKDEKVEQVSKMRLVALEQIFNRQDMKKNKEETIKPGDYIEVNIGTSQEPRMIKIGKGISKDERKNLINLVQEYRDVLAFSYEELKAYRENVIRHTIPLKQDIKTFLQKLRQINPKLSPMIHKELQKMVVAGIIAPTRHSSWCSNLIVVWKKNEGIRLCADFRNLNIACDNDNYPLPNMETLLQKVIGSRIMSMLDDFSDYNQVLVNKEDQRKITCTTPSGTYEYLRMPFYLLNAGATF